MEAELEDDLILDPTFDRTYEGLKHLGGELHRLHLVAFDRTYEGLKHDFRALARRPRRLLTVPMRV